MARSSGQSSMAQSAPVVLASDQPGQLTYPQSVAHGDFSDVACWSKIGYSPTVNTTESDMWSKAGVYAFCSTAGKWEVVGSENTYDIGTIIKGAAVNNSVQSDAGGTTTTLVDADVDFTASTAVAAGDCVILDPHGTSPEWGYVTTVAAHTLTVAGGFSAGGSGASRYYAVIDYSAKAGAHAVYITGLNASYAEIKEIVVLNGTTAVDTVGTGWYRVNSFRVIAAGANGKPSGNLTLQADGAGAAYSYITLGMTRARNNVYTVPLGKTLYVDDWNIGWSTPNDTKVQACRFILRANVEPGTLFKTGGIFYPHAEMVVSNAQVALHFDEPLKFPAKTDIRIGGVAYTGGSGAAVSALRGWLEE